MNRVGKYVRLLKKLIPIIFKFIIYEFSNMNGKHFKTFKGLKKFYILKENCTLKNIIKIQIQ